jgi:hypothetical protein
MMRRENMIELRHLTDYLLWAMSVFTAAIAIMAH